jgi:hypothetical protein
MFVTHLHDHIHEGAEDPCRACVVATEVSKEHPTSCRKKTGILKIQVFLYVMPCSLVNSYDYFEGS